MAFQTKKSVLAIVEETTEGTAVAPSSATDGYVALQDGFSFATAFEELENAELTGSIGVSKSQQGFETPSLDLDLYLRPSGVSGQEPDFGLLPEMAFGAKSVAATEYNTVGGSTAGSSTAAATIVVDAGEGVNFERGQALLIQDGVNGYAIRNVQSVSVDTLTLGQNLLVAPASGVNLGKAVLYKPGEAHKTATAWDYRANNGAVQVGLGMRVISMDYTVEAGQLINASYSLEGIQAGFNPFLIDATNDDFEFVDGAGTQSGSIAQGLYATPQELLSALLTAMDAASTDTITGSYSNSDGKFTLASDGITFELNCSTANSVFAAIGFGAVDLTGLTSYEAASAITLTAPHTPSFDTQGALVAKNNQVMLGASSDAFADIVCFEARSISVSMADEKTDVLGVCAESGKSSSAITGREVTVDIVADLPQYDSKKFQAFRQNQNIRFTYNFGAKSGGNWVKGQAGNMYLPTATVTSHTLEDQDGLVTLNISLKAYVERSLGEFYLNFL